MNEVNAPHAFIEKPTPIHPVYLTMVILTVPGLSAQVPFQRQIGPQSWYWYHVTMPARVDTLDGPGPIWLHSYIRGGRQLYV